MSIALKNHVGSFDPNHFRQELDVNGFCVLERIIPDGLRLKLRHDLEKAIQLDASAHQGAGSDNYGMVLFCPLYGSSFTELLELKAFIDPVHAVMGEHCIVYSYTSSSMPPRQGNYSVRVHNDCGIHAPKGYMLRLGALIMLDEFSEDNGSTWVLPGSHLQQEPPSEEYFYSNAIRVNAPAGSVWYAHPKVWHSGGLNRTEQWRHGVTIGFCRAYMKQRLDIPRLLSASNVDLSNFSQPVLQKLGFYAQAPSSYEEYYAPLEQRKFRQPVE